MDNSDYTKPRTNLNDYLPAVVKSKIAQTINENLFNRFLTKSEFVHADGIIGIPEVSKTVAPLKERTIFDQTYQLQPVIYEQVGTTNWFLTFKDFLNRLSRLGVDINNFDEWGASLQFNWVPPIDIDKLINYQNYYWNSDQFDDNPQYITIKNQGTWAMSRFNQVKKAIVNTTQKFTVVATTPTTMSVSGNKVNNFTVGEKLISLNSSGNYEVFTIQGVVFNNTTLNTDITVAESMDSTITILSKTFIPIQSLNILGNQIVLNGDVHLLFSQGYVFSTIGSPSQPIAYWKVASSVFDPVANTTTITVSGTVTNTFNWTQASVLPILSLSQAENDLFAGISSTDLLDTWIDYDIGRLVWYKNFNVTQLRTTGFTLLATNTFFDLNTDFISAGVISGDTLIIMSNDISQEYNIISVGSTVLTLESNVTFFNRTGVNYVIVRKQTFTSLVNLIQPTAPVVNQYWVDSTNDTLQQWNGTRWVTLQLNVSLIYNLPNKRNEIDIVQTDPWSAQNKWIHRNDIASFTGKTQAQLPIIEFYSYLELSQTSYATKAWKYRKGANDTYTESKLQPTLFELLNITFTSVLEPDFSFQTSSIILLNEQYGNLTTSLSQGTQIVLSGFNQNNGTYTVKYSEYVQLNPTSRFITRIYLTSPVVSVMDLPENASIAPKFTSFGDLFLGVSAGQWLLDGVSNVVASSINPEKNPMLDILVNTYSDSVVTHLDSLIGLVWQEYSLNSNSSVAGLQLDFDSSLHDLALYEDYQDGDIRVYINGVRQYGNFIELQSSVNIDYVGGIKFSNHIVIKPTDIVRVELGEYALNDIGKRAVNVLTGIGLEMYNIVDIRRVEQQKTDVNQYPQFCIYDINANSLQNASTIFEFAENSASPINLNILRRIVYDVSTNDYTFNQFLVGPNQELYLYKDLVQVGDELQSIWRKGTNNEQYVPQKLSSGEWALPNQWYYNIDHQNRSRMSLSELYRHFNSIIGEQQTPSIFSAVGNSLFYLDDNVNYGLGGTIKEHNNGLDLLVSAMFVNNVTPISLIQFAHDQYQINLRNIQDNFQQNAVSLLSYNTEIDTLSDLIDYIANNIKDAFENNEKYNQWFGDSTTYNPTTNTGVKNWLATVPYLFLCPKHSPYFIQDDKLNIVQVFHHNGHYSSVGYSLAVKNLIYKQLQKLNNVGTQIAPTSATPFPTSVNNNAVQNGTYLIRLVQQENATTLYRYNNAGIWETVNLDVILAQIILVFEQALYDNLPASSEVAAFKPVYDINRTNVSYDSLIEQQFSNYVKNNDITTPFSSIFVFKSNNPFTWNYAYTPVPIHPVTGVEFDNVAATWQALYFNIYGTAYPHREPWKLQGYVEKPVWWDAFYRDPTRIRYWQPIMWNNIFAGIIPTGKLSPTGAYGSGKPRQIALAYKFVSVNVGDTPTVDGVPPDGLLPPFWDTKNTTNLKIRSLYDPSLQQFIVTPQANYLFGQNGPTEWAWNTASQRLYDDLIVSFKLDPMKFMYFTFGTNFTNINCLQVDSEKQKVFSHGDTIFHGDFIPNTNMVYSSNGINQWYVHYNRYNGFDDVNFGFKSLWTEWTSQLSYLFNSFIDTSNFNISSQIFDISNKDYKVLLKRTQGISDLWLDALEATILNIPSIYVSNRDISASWTVQFDSTSLIGRSFNFYSPENYDFSPIVNTQQPYSADTFRIFSYPVVSAGVQDTYAYVVISYNQSLLGSSLTQLSNSDFEYWFTANVNNVGVKKFSIRGKNAQTFDELITQLNSQLGVTASASIVDGDIVVRSNVYGSASSLVIVDNGLFVSASPELFNNVGNQIIAPIVFSNHFSVNGNKTSVFKAGDSVVITQSTNFTGIFSLTDVSYDILTGQTTLEVKENVTIHNTVVDGILEPVASKTLPPTWQSGTPVYLNTTGILPSGLDDTTSYYIVILNSREFKLASAADTNVGISVSSKGIGDFFVGRVQSTFTVTASSNVWRRHYSDIRYIETVSPPYVVSGIQYMVDFIKGYDDYLQAQGFIQDVSEGSNIDPRSGLPNTWIVETQNFINSLYATAVLRNTIGQQYQISASSNGSYFVLANNFTSNWQVGTQVVLSAGDNSQLPTEFNNPLMSFVPYYIIPSLNKNTFQLALSLADANAGNAIIFGDNGFGDLFVTIYQNNSFPILELNPFKNYIWINTPLGIVSDVLSGNKADVLTSQFIYDNNGNLLSNKELIVLRQDIQTRISLTGKQQQFNQSSPVLAKYMQGMHIFLDGYEHILLMNNTTSDGYLIYDSFIGLNTPRLYVDFNKQSNYTLRPTVGGTVIQENSLVENFEAAADNLRYAYDFYNNSQNSIITTVMQQSMGYDGPYDYMTSLNINEKSQFIFWRGMIRQKGTIKSVNAFLNQIAFGNITVDEFWAYKLADFGDSKPRAYLELKLKAEDVQNKELRLEFVLPDETALDDTFIPIQLTDMNRWWNQPDQISKMLPVPTFYFNIKVIATIQNAEQQLIKVNGKNVLKLPVIADGVIVTYFDNTTFTNQVLSENEDFTYLNSTALIFSNNIFSFTNVTVYVVTYDYDSQNPARVFDKQAAATVTNVVVWNPALGQYYYNAMSVVDLKTNLDPAKYTYSADNNTTTNFWGFPQIGEVWFDDSKEGYIPYYDKQIFPNINDRLANWGKLADWATINLYEWTESAVPPSEWAIVVAADAADITIPQQNKRTGQVYQILYQNVSSPTSPVWQAVHDQSYDVIAGLASSTPITITFSSSSVNIVKIYINGIYSQDLNLGLAPDANNNLLNYILSQELNSYIHVVLPAPVPTIAQLADLVYKFDTPYSVVTKINKDTTQPYNTYYFWVTKKTNKQLYQNKITIFEAQQLFLNMTAPYMIITGFRDIDFGYGLIFGAVFDEDPFNVPYRFTQAIVRGLAGLITDENRYALTFTRDFTLRDKLPTGAMLNDVHTEWVLFRQKQLTKVDEFLWDKLVEALVGVLITERTLTTSQIPSLNRVLYDSLFGTDTKYGLQDDQIFTDSVLSLNTILGVLNGSVVDFGNIDISTFLSQSDFTSASGIATALYDIYDNFPIATVNYIYFQVLYDALSLKKQYKEFIKTSWVAIQIAQNVSSSTNVGNPNSYTLEPNGPCFLGQNTTEEFTFSTLTEYMLLVSTDGTLNYLSFDGTTLSMIRQELPQRIYGTGNITSVWSDGVYIYVSSANGGIDVYFFNNTNFVIVGGIALTNKITKLSGYNPILVISDGLDLFLFSGTSFTNIGSSGDFQVTNVKDVTVFQGYIITCGTGRLDAWVWNGATFILVNSLTNLIGGDDIIAVTNDGKYIYTGSDTAAKIQIFTFDGNAFNQVYTDPLLNSGPTLATGNGYLFMTGTDLYAYKFDGSVLQLVDTAQIGPTSSNITFSEDSQRLYVSDIGIFNFSNNKFEKLHATPIVANVVLGSVVLQNQLVNLPPPSGTPTPTPTTSLTPTPTVTASVTLTPTITPTISLTPTISNTPSLTPSTTLTPSISNTPTVTPSATVTPSITPSVGTSVTPTVTPTASVTITPTMTLTPTVTLSPTMTLTPTNTQTPTLTATASVTPTSLASPTPTQTVTPSITATMTPTVTPSNTFTPSPTASITPTNTVTPSVTPSITVSVSATASLTPTPTLTPTATPTLTPSMTVTPTHTITPTNTVTPTNSVTPTNTVTPSATLALTGMYFDNLGVDPSDMYFDDMGRG